MKEQLVQVIDKKDLQVLILTDGYNIHHLSGYRGHTGMLVAFQGEQYILTDSRYTAGRTGSTGIYLCGYWTGRIFQDDRGDGAEGICKRGQIHTSNRI